MSPSSSQVGSGTTSMSTVMATKVAVTALAPRRRRGATPTWPPIPLGSRVAASKIFQRHDFALGTLLSINERTSC